MKFTIYDILNLTKNTKIKDRNFTTMNSILIKEQNQTVNSDKLGIFNKGFDHIGVQIFNFFSIAHLSHKIIMS